MFEKLSSILDVCGEVNVRPQFAKNEILQHLTALENEFSRNCIEINDKELDLVIKPFKLTVEKDPVHCEDEFLGLRTYSGVKDMSDEKSVTECWPLMFNSYPKVTEMAIRALLPFVTPYFCFLTLLQLRRSNAVD